MKIAAVLLTFLVLFLPDAYPQEDMQLNLPEGAVERFGKGSVEEVLYSPDGDALGCLQFRSVFGSMIRRPIKRSPCSPGIQTRSIAYRSAQMERRSPVGVGGGWNYGMLRQAS